MSVSDSATRTRRAKPSSHRAKRFVLKSRTENDASKKGIVENKRLRHALAVIKAKQKHQLDVKILTNSEKVGYKKRTRPAYGPHCEVEDRLACERIKLSLIGHYFRDESLPILIPLCRRKFANSFLPKRNARGFCGSDPMFGSLQGSPQISTWWKDEPR